MVRIVRRLAPRRVASRFPVSLLTPVHTARARRLLSVSGRGPLSSRLKLSGKGPT